MSWHKSRYILLKPFSREKLLRPIHLSKFKHEHQYWLGYSNFSRGKSFYLNTLNKEFVVQAES